VNKHQLPLVIDLDGTLTPTDTLVESVLCLLKRSPTSLFVLLVWLLRGRVAFKEFVAANSGFSVENLPINRSLLDYLHKEKAIGRKLVLATASHKSVAHKVSNHLAIFDDVIATEGASNLKGVNKLEAIQRTVGNNFTYAGDSAVDIPIWRSASAAILVNVSRSTEKRVRAMTPIEASFSEQTADLKTWARAIRVHQWVKNLLIFVPLLTAFSFFDIDKLTNTVIAFFAFSLLASATYIVNDLWDLECDRTHIRKRHRPLASSEISIGKALIASVVLLLSGLSLALVISQQFLLMLLLYLFITSSYSSVLKHYVLLDVIILSLLYTLRILSGSVAIEVVTSTWLLAFSAFIFLSLALVKRCSELVTLQKLGGEAANGRDYRLDDLVVLWPLGVGSALSAIVVFGIFISSPDTLLRYRSPLVLWLVALGLIYWVSRLWVKTARGEMHDDPVVYALKDKGSRAIFMAMVIAVLGAQFVDSNSIF